MFKTPWLSLMVYIFLNSITAENTFIENNGTFIIDRESTQNTTVPVMNIFISMTLEKFLDVEKDFKKLIVNNADTYCHEKKILSTDSHLSIENVHLGNCQMCSNQMLQSNECVQCKLSVRLQARKLMGLQDLTTMWQDIQNSINYERSSTKQHEDKTFSKTIVIILLVIIIILIIILTGLLYVLRNTIRTLCARLCNRDNKPANDYTDGAFTNQAYGQYHQKTIPKSVTNESTTVYFQNEAYIESNSSTSGNTTSMTIPKSLCTESTLVDDFDSDTEMEINFPSPLNAPALPPRPIKSTPTTNTKQMHYMVSPIY